MKIISFILFVLSIFIISQKNSGIVRMNVPAIQSKTARTDTITTKINDTIPDKKLVVYFDQENDPVKYSRNIETGVCIDGECRLVQVNLFWNTTGRYLGFEIPNGEYFSKKEHDPFSEEDYNHLHHILAEDNSPLSQYEIQDLVPEKKDSNAGIDAVSSATIDAILNYIVEDAVYTTYTLWHIVYGPTKREIEKQTTSKLNNHLILKILNSGSIKDQIWVLNNIQKETELSDELCNKLIHFIAGEDIYLAERAINVLQPKYITEDIQKELVDIFQKTSYLQQKIILQKLENINQLSPQSIQIFSNLLPELNGTLSKAVIDLFSVHHIKNTFAEEAITKLLKSQNRYVAKQAAKYLINLEKKSTKTTKALNKYLKVSS